MASDTFPNFENFGNYILLKKLATGGMAEVFLARPANRRGNGRVQVIKRILPHVANDSEFIKMFQTEIQVCMGFNHAHTVQIHDFGEYNHQPYISMEYIEGKNLKEIINKFQEHEEWMPIPMALSFVAQAASGLGYAHTFVNKVTGEDVRAIHRDISPHNLIVDYDGNLKVIDFGIAKAASGRQDATQAGTIKGKFAYLSPEQITGEPMDARVDIFALGIVAWELLTLRRPFMRPGDSDKTILDTIINCDYNVKAPSYYNGAVPPELDEIILKSLRRDPKERYASAYDFQAALRHVMHTHYPEYSYSENAKLLQTMFQSEIEKERNELRLLNMNVQLTLNSTVTVTSTAMETTVVIEPAKPQKIAGADNVDQRLRGIEKLLKEKASTRHYIMFAFYLISIILLKIDQVSPLFDSLLPQFRSGAKIAAAQPVTATAPPSDPRAVVATVARRAPTSARSSGAARVSARQGRSSRTERIVRKASSHRSVVTQDQDD